MRGRWLLEAAGAALLFLLPYFYPLVVPRNITLYHHRFPVSNIVGGLLLDLLGAFVVGLVLIAILSRMLERPRRVISACMAALVCWRAAYVFTIGLHLWSSSLGQTRAVSGSDSQWMSAYFWNRFWHFSPYGFVIFFAALALSVPAVSQRVVRAVCLGLSAFSFCAIWIVPKLVEVAYARPARIALARISQQRKDDPGRRIVWILFDEGSYDLLFDHHPPGLATPNFGHLHSTSISFGNLQPVGFYTDRVVPSLISGFPIEQISSTTSGKLLYLDEHQRWQPYDPEYTLFALAQSEGWNPGVAGWYVPYCRTFGSILSRCSWVPGIQGDLPLEREGASENKSALANALILPEAPLARLGSHGHGGRTDLLELNMRDYHRMMNNAQVLMADGNIHFVFLHLPVPHPPGFYNRSTHQLSPGGNYLDNLVLADDALGELQQEINRTPWARQTTLIVSSDHSWRVPMWRNSRDWTAEEERISHGQFDPRPIFLIHFPGEVNGREILAPQSEFVEHEIVSAMLTGKIKDPNDLDRFQSQQVSLHSAPSPHDSAPIVKNSF